MKLFFSSYYLLSHDLNEKMDNQKREIAGVHYQLLECFKCDEADYDSMTFERTEVVGLKHDIFYKGHLSCRWDEASDAEIESCVERVPDEAILPRCPAGVTIFDKRPIPTDVFIKRICIVDYEGPGDDQDGPVGSEYFTKLMLNEIAVYEMLKHHPHPNIVHYHGVVIRDGWVVGIALSRLQHDLGDAYGGWTCDVPEDYEPSSEEKADRARWMKNIENGLAHLHGLGFAHNDLKQGNVMIDENGNAILIDFGGSAEFGKEVQSYGCPGWDMVHKGISSRENDTNGLKQIREKLTPEEHAGPLETTSADEEVGWLSWQ